ncbi:retrovirus-related pol polyprotein from transposon TNT 1-94 [Tanacetum coccineum]
MVIRDRRTFKLILELCIGYAQLLMCVCMPVMCGNVISYPRSNAIGSSFNRNRGTSTEGPTKVIRCYNCQEEGHVARQCTKPKWPRNSTWFKEKALLSEALELGVALNKEQMAFLAENGKTVTTAPSAKVVLMAKLSAYDSDVLSDVPTHDNYLDNHVNE